MYLLQHRETVNVHLFVGIISSFITYVDFLNNTKLNTIKFYSEEIDVPYIKIRITTSQNVGNRNMQPPTKYKNNDKNRYRGIIFIGGVELIKIDGGISSNFAGDCPRPGGTPR